MLSRQARVSAVYPLSVPESCGLLCVCDFMYVCVKGRWSWGEGGSAGGNVLLPHETADGATASQSESVS